jgi:hypothetical protein
VAITHPFEFVGASAPVERVLADRLEELVTIGGVIELEQGLIDESTDEFEHEIAVEAITGDDMFGSGSAETAEEHRNSPQQDLLVTAEQIVAPVYRGLECLLARHFVSRATGQNPESFI